MPVSIVIEWLLFSAAVVSCAAMIAFAIRYIRTADGLYAYLKQNFPNQFSGAPLLLPWGVSPDYSETVVKMDMLVKGYSKIATEDMQYKNLLRAARYQVLFCFTAMVAFLVATGFLLDRLNGY